jgi:4-hydroxy 2-oxovalerate aldolase
MKLLDVTLRDGGFVNDFNWRIDDAKQHIKIMNQIGIHYIELGYWKQVAKSSNPFYNMNEQVLDEIEITKFDRSQYCIMVDFHYCPKNTSDYPKKRDGAISLIRITSRKEDFFDAVKFAYKLKHDTGLEISFQIINSTNYSAKEMRKSCEQLVSNEIDIVGFADSHGNLNLYSDFHIFEESISMLNENSRKWGFHLHNHTGRAISNFLYLKHNTNCPLIDASVNGLGKGLGNLRLEEIVDNEAIPYLLTYMASQAPNEMSIPVRSAYHRLTGRHNVTDNYSKFAIENNITINEFPLYVRELKGMDRDSYNPKLWDSKL